MFLYDWRNQNSGVGVAFEEGEEKVCCYNVGNPDNMYDWDVTIVEDQYKLTIDQCRRLKLLLAHLWQINHHISVLLK